MLYKKQDQKVKTMKKTLRKTSAMLCAITVVASSMSLSGFVANAGDEPVTSDYTITIPATLAVANSGWNALEGGISAKGTLESGKKLVITPTSENGWKLVSGENNVGYNLAKERCGDRPCDQRKLTDK